MRPWWPIVAVCAAGVLAYVNTLGHGFVWDDLIALDQHVRFYRSPLDAFVEPPDNPGFPGVFRPLSNASFWLDQLVWWRNPFGFHLTSVALHGLTTGLVYLLARRLACAPVAALVAALLFAVHPIHTESVAWITARVDVLAATFTIAAVLASFRARAAGGTPWLFAVAACSFAAAASKEPAIVVPLLVALATSLPAVDEDRLRLVPRAPVEREHDGRSVGARERRAAWMTIAASATGVIAYLLLRAVNRAGDTTHLDLGDPASALRLFRAFGFYVGRLVAPIAMQAYVPEVPGGVTVVLFAVVGVGVAAALVRHARARFAVAWILLTLAPSLTVVLAGISVTAVAERYLYLPSVGFSLLVGVALTAYPGLVAGRAARAAIACVLLLLATATIARNRIWRDEIALWSDVTAHEQRFALPYMNLGLALGEAERLDEAEAAYRKALDARANPTTTRNTSVNLGHLELRRGRLDDALALFTRANAMAPHASAYYGIAAVYRTRARTALAGGDAQAAAEGFTRARDALLAALRINDRHYKSHFLLGSVLYQMGDYPGALGHYKRVVEIAADTDHGRDAVEAGPLLETWLADPANRRAAPTS
jgi:tetratricopeptide (TPR) repeat protein